MMELDNDIEAVVKIKRISLCSSAKRKNIRNA